MLPTTAAILDDARKHELDAWVAEHVLGYRWLISPWSKSRKRYLAPPSDHKFGTPARGDEPALLHDHTRFTWTRDMGHAWEVIEAVRAWPPEGQMRFLTGLAMQHNGSEHPLEWLAFVCPEPALALCRAALIASLETQGRGQAASGVAQP